MARVFIAASYTRLKEAASLCAELERHGHIVVSTWIHEPSREYLQGDAAMERSAKVDFRDLQQAEVVVCLTGDNGTRVERHSEVGMALGTGKRVILLGTREQIYHWYPAVRVVNTIRRLIEVLA